MFSELGVFMMMSYLYYTITSVCMYIPSVSLVLFVDEMRTQSALTTWKPRKTESYKNITYIITHTLKVLEEVFFI